MGRGIGGTERGKEAEAEAEAEEKKHEVEKKKRKKEVIVRWIVDSVCFRIPLLDSRLYTIHL